MPLQSKLSVRFLYVLITAVFCQSQHIVMTPHLTYTWKLHATTNTNININKTTCVQLIVERRVEPKSQVVSKWGTGVALTCAMLANFINDLSMSTPTYWHYRIMYFKLKQPTKHYFAIFFTVNHGVNWLLMIYYIITMLLVRNGRQITEIWEPASWKVSWSFVYAREPEKFIKGNFYPVNVGYTFVCFANLMFKLVYLFSFIIFIFQFLDYVCSCQFLQPPHLHLLHHCT